MNTEEIARIVSGQRAYFKTHATFDVDARRRALMRLRDAVRAHEDDIAHALKTDLGKSHDEAYMCEIGTSLSEIRHQIAHVARWSRLCERTGGRRQRLHDHVVDADLLIPCRSKLKKIAKPVGLKQSA